MKLLALVPIGMQVILSGCMPLIWYSGFPDVNHSSDTSASEAILLSYGIASVHSLSNTTIEEALMRKIIQREFSHWTEMDPNKGPLENHVGNLYREVFR